jgi:hypothetical protein
MRVVLIGRGLRGRRVSLPDKLRFPAMLPGCYQPETHSDTGTRNPALSVIRTVMLELSTGCDKLI